MRERKKEGKRRSEREREVERRHPEERRGPVAGMTRIRDRHNGSVSVFVGTGDCGNDR